MDRLHRQPGVRRAGVAAARRPATEVDRVWKQAAPVVDWLDAHVGPSEKLPPR